MDNLHIAYRKQIKNSLDFWATWLPTSPINVGEIVTLRRNTGELDRIGILDDFGVDLGDVNSDQLGVLSYLSSDVHVVSADASADISIRGAKQGGVTFKFKHAGGVVFRSEGCVIDRCGDIHSLGEKILKLDSDGKWSNDFLIVTEVVRSSRAVVLVAQSDDAEADIKCAWEHGHEGDRTAFLRGGVGITSSNGLGFELVSDADATPLFGVYKLRRSLIKGRRLVGFRLRALSAWTALSKGIGQNSPIAKYRSTFEPAEDHDFLS